MTGSPERGAGGRGIATSLAWFAFADYEEAIARWPSLAEDWADCPHGEYCRRFESDLRRLSSQGVPITGVAPIRLADYVPWCNEEGRDPESPASRAHYAAELTRRGRAIPWPPRRNDPCWCGSRRKYKQCCGMIANASDADV